MTLRELIPTFDRPTQCALRYLERLKPGAMDTDVVELAAEWNRILDRAPVKGTSRETHTTYMSRCRAAIGLPRTRMSGRKRRVWGLEEQIADVRKVLARCPLLAADVERVLAEREMG